MYTSGQFAGMFRVSKKLLRHYQETGLLKPAEIDSNNGYAYYDENSCKRMKKILYLRSLHIPLSIINQLIELPEDEWTEKIHQQLVDIRREQRSLERIEKEIIILEERLASKRDIFERIEFETKFEISVFHLDNPIYVIGRAARIIHGSPEHQPTIKSLISDFYGDDVPSMIPNRREPGKRFGICAELNIEIAEFTYMMGDQTLSSIEEVELPTSTRSYVIPAGDYACVTFSASDIETLTTQTLGRGYDELFGWLGSSNEWESSVMGVAYEVYDDERFEIPSWPEMDIWTPICHK